jgi:TPP-dependent indolepyruvate ferredoxin oxidoreductase alpha subunit
MRDAGARIADELKKGGPEGQKLAAEFERNLEARISEAEKAAGAELGETMKKEAAEAARKEQRGVRHVKQPGADKAYDPFRSLRPGPKDPKR